MAATVSYNHRMKYVIVKWYLVASQPPLTHTSPPRHYILYNSSDIQAHELLQLRISPTNLKSEIQSRMLVYTVRVKDKSKIL